MSETSTANPPDWAQWKELLKWSPFKIDALGLVTLLGAEEVNASVGRLVRSTWFEYFPLLGAFVVAGNSFRNKEAGFNLYNITQGIHTTDLAAWLTRWMRSQDFDTTRSIVRWTVEPRKVSALDRFLGMVLPFCANGMLIAMTVLSYDWYGFANAISMVMQIVVRCYMIASIRNSIDNRVDLAYRKTKPDHSNTWPNALARWESGDKRTADAEDKQPTRPHPLEYGWNGTKALKVLIIMNDAKAVTMLIPRDLMAPPSVFVANLEPWNRALYGIARWVGWLSFAVQIVTIGMADLATQIVTVALLIIPTVLFIGRLGCADSTWQKNIAWFFRKLSPRLGNAILKEHDYGPAWPELKSVSWIGSMLKAEVYEWPWSHEFPLDEKGNLQKDRTYDPTNGRPGSKRQHLYAWLQISAVEKLSMDKWDLFPHERADNTSWLDVYKDMTKRIAELPDHNWGVNSMVEPATVPPPPPKPTEQTELPRISHDSQPPQLSPISQAPAVPKIDTKMSKHHYRTTVSSKEEEDQNTTDTAQDGTVLNLESPSIHNSPEDIVSLRNGQRLSTGGFQSVQDIRDGIRPIQRASTVPHATPAHATGRRPSGASALPRGGAYWVSSNILEQQYGATSESDETVVEDRPEFGASHERNQLRD